MYSIFWSIRLYFNCYTGIIILFTLLFIFNLYSILSLNELTNYIKYINLGDLIAILGSIDFVLGSVDLGLIPFSITGFIIHHSILLYIILLILVSILLYIILLILITSSLWSIYFYLELHWMLLSLLLIIGNSVYRGLLNHLIINSIISIWLTSGIIFYNSLLFIIAVYGKLGYFPFIIILLFIFIYI
jgi:hypothetical protein